MPGIHRHERDVRPVEEPLAGSQRDRGDVQPQLIDQAGDQVLVDGGGSAGDGDGPVAGGRAGLDECRLKSVGDEGERCPALHGQRVALVMSEDEHWRVVGRLLAPPASPGQIPLAAPWTEHVAAHDVGAD